MPRAEADQVLAAGDRCTFNRSRETDPILWINRASGGAAMKLNGVLVALAAAGEAQSGSVFSAPGSTITVRPLGEEADWRSDAELVFSLDKGFTVGYRGFYGCGAARAP